MKIGVFDSGIGGLHTAKAIEKALPEHEIIFMNDSVHVPYGSRAPEEILGFVVPIFQKLINDGCQVIVVACNTVTTTLIGELRSRFATPLVAVEPMVKPAAELTKSKVIAVCATPTTLASRRYNDLKRQFAHDIKVLEPDCSDWTAMIETNQVDVSHVRNRIQAAVNEGADVIVLGCTHYHWIEKLIQQIALGHAQVIQPEQALIRQLRRVLERLA